MSGREQGCEQPHQRDGTKEYRHRSGPVQPDQHHNQYSNRNRSRHSQHREPGERRARAAHQPRPPTPSRMLRAGCTDTATAVLAGHRDSDDPGAEKQLRRAWRFHKGVSGAHRHPAPTESPAAVTSRGGPPRARSTQVHRYWRPPRSLGRRSRLPRRAPAATQLREISDATRTGVRPAGPPKPGRDGLLADSTYSWRAVFVNRSGSALG